MAKIDVVRFVAKKSGINQEAAAHAIDAFMQVIRVCLEDEGRFTYPGLGVFSVETRAARRGRNPHTNEAIDIPAKQVVRFKAAPSFVELWRGEVAAKD